jgi:hypothetical protein
MNTKTIALQVLLALSLGLVGCATTAQYPVTYQVPIGPSQVRSDFGPPNLVVNAVQDVPARAGALLYYQVVAPVNIVFYAFDKTGPGPGGPILSQLQGTSFYSSVVPSSDGVEFVFSSTLPVSSGSVQLTVSDTPFGTGIGTAVYGPTTAQLVQQPQVSISPPSASVVTGQSVTFSVAGGSGSGDFVWGGAAPASGWSNTYTFNAPGTYTVVVYRNGDANYAQSASTAATVTVSAPVTPITGSYNQAVTVTPIR